MKVFIVTKEPLPNGMAATNRIKCYARAIKEGGLDCEVIICGCTEFKRNQILNTEAIGEYEGVPFRYIGGTTTDTRKETIRRFFQLLRLLKTVVFLYKNLKRGDVLFMYMGGRVKWMLRFMKVAHKKGAYCVRDLAEFPYVTGKETEYAIKMRRVTIEKQFPKLNGIVSISDALMDFAMKYTCPKCKHIKVPIMVEYEHYAIAKSYEQANIPYIFHSGTLLQQKDGILGMIEAFGIAKQELSMPIKYILTGEIEESSHPAKIKEIIQKYHLEDSVEFVGYLLRNQIKEYLSRASLVISNRPKSKQDYYGFSTKLGEYLASGTPLITTNWGEATKWLKNEVSAYIVEPENTKALANTIVSVFCNPSNARLIGKRGQEVCQKNFDFRSWSAPLVSFLRNLEE